MNESKYSGFMNKKISLFLFAIVILMLTTTPVSALEVIIDSTGNMTFYNDGVLGDSTDDSEFERKSKEMNERHQNELRAAKETEKESITRRQAQEKSQLQRESDQVRKNQITTVSREQNQTPLRVISPAQEKELRIKREENELEVEVTDKELRELNSVEQSNPQRLRVELNAAPRKALTEEQLEEIGNRNAQIRLQERQERIGEKIELRRSTDDPEQPLELESRDVKAKIYHSAQFVIDPETNLVQVIKPNGELATVIHLPDQALERMRELGKISPDESGVDLEMVTDEEGKVVYKLKAMQKRKFLGIFNRDVETEIELDDETGLTEETEVERTGFQGFLDRLTF